MRIEVWDTGLGIPEESRADVFREFARLEPAQRSAPGLGLGLSIVERLAKVLEADLGLRSRVGAGSVFFVDIPLSAAVNALGIMIMLAAGVLAEMRRKAAKGAADGNQAGIIA